MDSARRWMDRWRHNSLCSTRAAFYLPHSPPPCALARPRRPTPTTVHTTIAYGCTTYVYASVAMRRAPRSTLRLWVAPRFGHHLCAISSAEIAPPALSTPARRPHTHCHCSRRCPFRPPPMRVHYHSPARRDRVPWAADQHTTHATTACRNVDPRFWIHVPSERACASTRRPTYRD